MPGEIMAICKRRNGWLKIEEHEVWDMGESRESWREAARSFSKLLDPFY